MYRTHFALRFVYSAPLPGSTEGVAKITPRDRMRHDRGALPRRCLFWSPDHQAQREIRHSIQRIVLGRVTEGGTTSDLQGGLVGGAFQDV